MERKGRSKGGAPGGAKPRRGKAQPGAPQQRGTKRKGARTGRRQAAPRSYTPEQRRQAVEAYERSGLTRVAFSKTWGISASSLDNWLRRARTDGGKGLEDQRKGKAGRKKGRRTLADSVQRQIVSLKTRFPAFGFKRLRDVLRRAAGVRVSAGTVRAVVKDAGLPPTERPKRRRRSRKTVRRFERSRPNELWQSDITSVWLARPARRVYLTVFLDDYSRYVLAFVLATHQRRELVLEALEESLVRFGKPKEILTDQGRQYYSWRGKTDFQKRLEREGIQHVVSRAHHPETLGKTERLWKTIADELWSRIQPADLSEARARLAHYLAHYNHHRPHQGLDGLVPADRFFGVEKTARATIEKALRKNELALALGEEPRQPVFLFGRIGNRQLSLHGEKGKLILSTDEGVSDGVALDALGAPRESEHGDEGEERDGDRAVADPAGTAGPETAAPLPQEDLLQEGAARPVAGAGAVAGGQRGGPGAGAPALRDDAGVLAGQAVQAGGGAAAAAAAAADLAAEPAGAGGYAGGAGASAALEGGRRSDDAATRREGRAPGSAQAGQGAGDRAGHDAQGGRAAQAVSTSRDEERPARDEDETGADSGRGKKAHAEKDLTPPCASPSEPGCDPGTSRTDSDACSEDCST